MNKAELIDVLTEKMGSDRRQATAAVEHVVDTIVRAVHKGDSVTITGFGVFEQRKRAARVARNPRTGETVKVKPTSVPAFRPGAQFKAVVAGSQKLPADGPAVKRGVVGGPAKKVAATRVAKAAAAKKVAAKAAAKKAPAKTAASAQRAPARKTSAKAGDAKAGTARKPASKKAAARPVGSAPARGAGPRKPAAKVAVAKKVLVVGKPAAKTASKTAARTPAKAAPARKAAPVRKTPTRPAR